MKIGLIGPVTGVPGYNYSAFNIAAASLKAAGYDVFSPAEITPPSVLESGTMGTWRYFMRKTIPALIDCDGIAELPNTATSIGGALERYIMSVLGTPIKDVQGWIDYARRDYSKDR